MGMLSFQNDEFIFIYIKPKALISQVICRRCGLQFEVPNTGQKVLFCEEHAPGKKAQLAYGPNSIELEGIYAPITLSDTIVGSGYLYHRDSSRHVQIVNQNSMQSQIELSAADSTSPPPIHTIALQAEFPKREQFDHLKEFRDHARDQILFYDKMEKDSSHSSSDEEPVIPEDVNSLIREVLGDFQINFGDRSRLEPVFLFADSRLLFQHRHGKTTLAGICYLLENRKPSKYQVRGRNIKAAYIGASNGDVPDHYGLFVSAMEGAGIAADQCRMIPSFMEKPDIQFLSEASIILLAGGDIKAGWDVFCGTGMQTLITKRYYEGAFLVGVTEGAVQLGMKGFASSKDPGSAGGASDLFDTFGFVPYVIGVREEPEWEKFTTVVSMVTEERKSEYRLGEEVAEELIGYGIPGGGGLIAYPDGFVEPLIRNVVKLRGHVDSRRVHKSVVLPHDTLFLKPQNIIRNIANMEVVYDEIARLIARSNSVVILTGAGCSKESVPGIPTYRDSEDATGGFSDKIKPILNNESALWNQYDPKSTVIMNLANVKVYATLDGFNKYPEKCWELTREFHKLVNQVRPNRAHFAIAELHAMGLVHSVITQNVDSLHQRAGLPEHSLIEIHGHERSAICLQCQHSYMMEELDLEHLPPTCRKCQVVLKPECVFFGETIPDSLLRRSREAALMCDVMLVVGTSSVVYPVADLPRLATQVKAKVIEINMERTTLNDISDYIILEKAGTSLSKIVERVRMYKFK